MIAWLLILTELFIFFPHGINGLDFGSDSIKNFTSSMPVEQLKMFKDFANKREIPCPNTTDDAALTTFTVLSDVLTSAYAGISHIPEIEPDAISELKKLADQSDKCMNILRGLQKQKWANEKQGMQNLTTISIQRMQSAIDMGFKKLHDKLNAIRKEISRGNAIMDEVDKLSAENKYRKFKVKLEILMEKFRDALNAEKGDVIAIVTFVEMCNSVQHNDKFIIQELDEVVSMEKTTYIGLSMQLKYYTDEVFLQAFEFISLLINDLRSFRSLCYIQTNKITDMLSPQVDKQLSMTVKGQIQQIYGKIVALNKQREAAYFTKDNLFPPMDGDSKKRMKQAMKSPRGYDPYFNNNYVLFDTRNYTVYKRYRYSIEFGDGHNFHNRFNSTWRYFDYGDEFFNETRFRYESMGIKDPQFSCAYDKQHVAVTPAIDIQRATAHTPYEARRKMYVVRSRINDPEYPIPEKNIDTVENFLRADENKRKSPRQLLEGLWCHKDNANYQLAMICLTPANQEEIETNEEDILSYPTYGFGNCDSLFMTRTVYTHYKTSKDQWMEYIYCFFVANEQCSTAKEGKPGDYIRIVDM